MAINKIDTFKGWALQNFPFIEADFDALTNYELMCKIVEYLNKTIDSQNEVITEFGQLHSTFIDLQNHVDDYFDNLDVQNEINNKLDAMVDDGTFDQIINQELFGQLNSKINTLDSNVLTDLVVVGDSYSVLNNSNWAEKVASQLHLTLHKLAQSSMGYTNAVNGKVFIDRLDEIDSSYANKVKYVICYGGINDNNSSNFDTLTTAVTNFCTTAKTKCPNAQILIIGPQTSATQHKLLKNKKCANAIRKGAITAGCSYTDARDWLISAGYPYTMTYQNDYLHPSNLGFNIIVSKIMGVINNSVQDTFDVTITLGDGFVGGTVLTKMQNGFCHFQITCPNTNYTTGTTIGTWSNSNSEFNFCYGLQYYPVFDYVSGTFKGLVRFRTDGNLNYVGSTLSSTPVMIQGDIYFGQIEES